MVKVDYAFPRVEWLVSMWLPASVVLQLLHLFQPDRDIGWLA